MTDNRSVILDQYGRRFQKVRKNGKDSRPWPVPAEEPRITRLKRERYAHIHGTFDLAQTDKQNSKHWAAADAYDADSANSRGPRILMLQRSRYETGNNGYVEGITKSYATFAVRTGPRLRLTSEDEQELRETTLDKDQIKQDWHRWCRAIQLRRKLWCMAHAKVQDGESFAVIRHNPNIAHKVKLDLVPFEAEQCQTPILPYGQPGYIDGIRFDQWGNPIYYDVLPVHPGSQNVANYSYVPDRIPARYIAHWFTMERPGQHRGLPAMKSTLGLGAVGRRWREANVASAETIADIALIAQTQGAPFDGADEVAPFSSIEWQKRMLFHLPMGWSVYQPQGTHPPANYEMFVRANVSETARPTGMPFNLAAADSSRHNFASGKLDMLPFYMQLDDLERQDCNEQVLDKLFAIWWREYVLLAHGRGEMREAEPDEPPDHDWDWPKNPVADEASEVRTNAEKLRTGQAAPSDIAHANSESFEDQLRKEARDYGKTVDEMREAHFQVNIAPKSGGTLKDQGQPANREQPEQNGEDAPTMEQLSMVVGQVDQLQWDIQATQQGARSEINAMANQVAQLAQQVSALTQQLRDQHKERENTGALVT